MGKAKIDWKKHSKLGLYAFVVFTLIMAAFPMLIESKFTFDEYFTINLVKNSWTDVIRLTGLDVHPPLYYLAVKLDVAILGENFLAYHLVSFVCWIALVIVTEQFVSKVFGDKEALFAVLALCCAPNMLRYALQVRMYSMAMLLVTLGFYTTWFLGEQYSKNSANKKVWKYWVLLAVINVAAAYTHYFAGVAAVGVSCALLVYLLLTKRDYVRTLIQWCVYCLIMAVLYLPWMFVMFKQMRDINGNYWITALSIETLYGYLDMLLGMSKEFLQYGLTVTLFLGCFYLVTKKDKSRRDYWKWGAFIAAGVFMVFGVGYSVLKTPILIDRYVVILVPMLWVVVVVTLAERKEKWIEAGLVILFCLCFIVNQKDLYSEYQAVQNSEETRCLENNVMPGDIMYHTNAQRLAERAAFLTDTEHLLLEGCDEGEAFHYWSDMIGCKEVAGVSQVIELAENKAATNASVSIWCEDDTVLEEFKTAGWQVEEYPAWSVVFYRLYRP